MTAFYDLESESAVLGSILLHGEESLGTAISAELDPKHFYDEKHRILYRAFIRLASAGEPINLLSAKKSLEASEQLDDCEADLITHIQKIGIPLIAVVNKIELGTDRTLQGIV